LLGRSAADGLGTAVLVEELLLNPAERAGERPVGAGVDGRIELDAVPWLAGYKLAVELRAREIDGPHQGHPTQAPASGPASVELPPVAGVPGGRASSTAAAIDGDALRREHDGVQCEPCRPDDRRGLRRVDDELPPAGD